MSSGVKIRSSWSAKEGTTIPAGCVTWIEDDGSEAAAPATVTGVPEWCGEGVVLTKPSSGKRCELLITFPSVHEILECEVVSSARIVELYGSTEEEGDCYWQSSRSKEGFDGLWHCPALLPQGGTKRVSSSPLVIKLFSLSPPTTACTLMGVRVRVSGKATKKPSAMPPQTPSLHEMVSLAARFLKGGATVGQAPSTVQPPPANLASLLSGQAAPPQRAKLPSPTSSSPTNSESIQVPLTTITLMQQQMKETTNEYEKRMTAMERRMAMLEDKILPKIDTLITQVNSLQGEVDALKMDKDKAPSTPVQTPSLGAAQTPSSSLGTPGTPSKKFMEAREERRRERQSCPPGMISPIGEKKMFAELRTKQRSFSSMVRSSSVPTEKHQDVSTAKKFFGFSNNSEFREWVEKASCVPKAPVNPPTQRKELRKRSSSTGARQGDSDDKSVRSPSDIPVRGVMACQRKSGPRSPNTLSFQLN
eukprot:TRINITY_DN10226_c1_g1_i1.p1 TRINITY_DN10226_c1_g1~~TRINITY_DN10226_c1_g1_i1.p1  ORF type:complete len:476 (+),score=120.60 TRINITY_DN10226_c1_g1_i1:40-1467(+)